jgi:hypothetical protein
MKASKMPRFLFLLITLSSLFYLSFNCIGRKNPEAVFNYRGKNIFSFSKDIILLDSSRNIRDVSNFTGSIYLLEFYSNNCKSCPNRKKILKRLSSAYMKARVTMVLINTGGDTFEEFASNTNARREFQLYDEGGMFTRNLGITSVPAGFLLDETGTIRHFWIGDESLSEEEFFQENKVRIDSLLVTFKTGQ